jgi:hypothetical protein
MTAVRQYASQAGRQAMDPRLVESWARLRGSFVGVEFAEAFRLLRLVDNGDEPEAYGPARTVVGRGRRDLTDDGGNGAE